MVGGPRRLLGQAGHRGPEDVRVTDGVERQGVPPYDEEGPQGVTPTRPAAPGETDARQDPLSTFALDVDTASYGFVARSLRAGRLPSPSEVRPEEFVALSDEAERIGFLGVMAGPLVRSSYRAGRLWGQAMRRRGQEIPAALAHLGEERSSRQEASSLLAR